MPRPIKKLNAENFYAAREYFGRLLLKDRIEGSFNHRLEGETIFKKLPLLDKSGSEKIKEEAIKKFQVWIDVYAADKWQNFLGLQRTKRFKKQHALRMIEIHEQAYYALRGYAEKVNLGLSDAIEKLAKPALKKIRDAEWEHKQAKTKKVTR